MNFLNMHYVGSDNNMKNNRIYYIEGNGIQVTRFWGICMASQPAEDLEYESCDLSILLQQNPCSVSTSVHIQYLKATIGLLDEMQS